MQLTLVRPLGSRFDFCRHGQDNFLHRSRSLPVDVDRPRPVSMINCLVRGHGRGGRTNGLTPASKCDPNAVVCKATRLSLLSRAEFLNFGQMTAANSYLLQRVVTRTGNLYGFPNNVTANWTLRRRLLRLPCISPSMVFPVTSAC